MGSSILHLGFFQVCNLLSLLIDVSHTVRFTVGESEAAEPILKNLISSYITTLSIGTAV